MIFIYKLPFQTLFITLFIQLVCINGSWPCIRHFTVKTRSTLAQSLIYKVLKRIILNPCRFFFAFKAFKPFYQYTINHIPGNETMIFTIIPWSALIAGKVAHINVDGLSAAKLWMTQIADFKLSSQSSRQWVMWQLRHWLKWMSKSNLWIGTTQPLWKANCVLKSFGYSLGIIWIYTLVHPSPMELTSTPSPWHPVSMIIS